MTEQLHVAHSHLLLVVGDASHAGEFMMATAGRTNAVKSEVGGKTTMDTATTQNGD